MIVHLLLVDAWMPTPTTDSASLRLCEMMRLLRDMGCEVTFIPDDLNVDRGAVDLLTSIGVRVLGAPAIASLAAHLKQSGGDYDIILMSRVYVAEKHMDDVKRLAPNAAVIFDTVDLHYLRLFRWAKVERNGFLLKQAMENKRQELWLAREADLTLVVSTYEVDVLAKECPEASVLILPTIHRVCSSSPSFDSRSGVLFLGSFSHQANVDAARYFVEDIWPPLRERIPGITARIVGPDAPDWLKARDAEDFAVLGYVPELAPELERARLSVAPIRFGAGIKGKVLLSMGQGLPVVGTSVAAEGMPVDPGRDLLVADDATGFCDAVEAAYTNASTWEALSANGREFIREHYTPEAVGARLRDMLALLGKGA